ncbi:MAG: BON domain-containing protein [Jiangellaceae bacterium]
MRASLAKVVVAVVAAVVGSAIAYVLDPDRGRARRARLADQMRATLRRDARLLERRAHYERGRVEGLVHKTTNRHHRPPENDQVLLDKVRSEVFGRMPEVAHHISVDAAKGVVTLRGQLAEHDSITRLETAVGRVGGVEDVVNLVHRPGEPAPNKAAALQVGH